ncbi:MAG: PAS domain-containing protein, partial [Acidobacteriota bacterium]
MTSPPWWAQSSVRASFSRDLIGYICALLVSWFAAMLTMHVPALHGTPLALNLASIIAITLLFSIRQGITAVIATAFIFYFRFLLPDSSSYLAPGAVIRTAIILVIGWFIAWLAERYRMIGVRLRTALHSLREHADTLAQAQQGSHSAAWVFKIDDRTLRWAHGGAELLGRPFSDVATFDALLELIHSDDRSAVRQSASLAQSTGGAFHAEFRVKLPDGQTRWLEARGRVSNRDSLWRGVVLDVTNRKQAELALLRSEKLAAIGRLSATVAHEINNPLEAVTNLLYLATLDETLSPQTRGFLDTAEQELKRLASIARHTLTFARVRPAAGPTDIVALIE